MWTNVCNPQTCLSAQGIHAEETCFISNYSTVEPEICLTADLQDVRKNKNHHLPSDPDPTVRECAMHVNALINFIF